MVRFVKEGEEFGYGLNITARAPMFSKWFWNWAIQFRLIIPLWKEWPRCYYEWGEDWFYWGSRRNVLQVALWIYSAKRISGPRVMFNAFRSKRLTGSHFKLYRYEGIHDENNSTEWSSEIRERHLGALY